MQNRKDIFVDTNLAKNFCAPVSGDLREFIRWLFFQGSLVVTNNVIREYRDACQSSASQSSILVIIDHQTRRGRLVKISNESLKGITFQKKELRLIKSNRKDHEHLKAVLLSRRRMTLTNDKAFAKDVIKLPRIRGIAAASPKDLPYRKGK